ncbi:MAG: hypothetical protein Kow0059_09780 [Candidatus Sumerlaeia bacterium]
MPDFVHLKVRSYWTAAGTSSPTALVWRAVSQEHQCLALTDEMTLAGAPEFAAACRQAGIRPVFGSIVYHAPASAERPSPAGYPITLLAETAQGFENLLQIHRRLGVPEIPWQPGGETLLLPLRDLLRDSDGLVALIGGPHSELSHSVSEGNARAAAMFLNQITDLMDRSNIFVEITRRGEGEPGQAEAGLLELAQRWNLTPVATNDVYCASPASMSVHLLLKRAGTRPAADEVPLPGLPAAAVPHLASAGEMLRKFSDQRKLCLAAAELAERCSFSPDPGLFAGAGETAPAGNRPVSGSAASPENMPRTPVFFPQLDYPRGQSEESFVWNTIFTRAREQHAQITTQLKERLNREFEALKNAGCLPFLAFFARLIEALPERLTCYRFRRPTFTSSQAAFYLGLNELSPYDLKIAFSLDEILAGLGGAVELEIPTGGEAEFTHALAALIGPEQLAMNSRVLPPDGQQIAQWITRGLGLQGREADAACEFLSELAGESPTSFFSGDMSEPGPEDILNNPLEDRSMAKLFFEMREASPRLGPDPGRLVFSNFNLARHLPVYRPGDRQALEWPLETLAPGRFPVLTFESREELLICTRTMIQIHREGLHGAPRNFAAVPIEHRSVMELMNNTDTSMIPLLDGIEARVALRRLAPESFSALTKIQIQSLANRSFFDRVAELALACKMAYLQMNFPQDYFLVHVGRCLDRPQVMRRTLRRLRREHVPVYPPRLNISTPPPTLRDGGLQLGLAMLKGYSDPAYDDIAAARREKPFSNLVDFLQRMDLNRVRPEFIDSLIQSGAFDVIEPRRRLLWEQWKRITAWLKEAAASSAHPHFLSLDWNAIRSLCAEVEHDPDCQTDWPLLDRLEHERRACGFEISGDPMEGWREFLDLSNIYTGAIGKRALRRNVSLFWAGYVETWSVKHPTLEGLNNHALLDAGEFWAMIRLEAFEAHRDWIERFAPGVFQITPIQIQGLLLFEVEWCAPLDQCAREAAECPVLDVDCRNWQRAQFRQLKKLCRLFPGETRLRLLNVPQRFARKAARLQTRGVYYTPTFYRAIPGPM